MIAVLKGKDLRIEFANSLFLQTLGKSHVIIGKKLTEVFPEFKEHKILTDSVQILKTGQKITLKDILIKIGNRKKENTKNIYLTFMLQPLFSQTNKVKTIIANVIDVTDYVNAEIETERLDLKLREQARIVESSDDAIIGLSTEGIITSWNNGAKRLYGYRGEEAIGQSASMLIAPEKKDDFPKIMRKISQGISIDHYETQRITKKRRILDVSITVSPIRDKNEKIIGASKITRDITDRKNSENNLRFLSDASKLFSSSLNYKTTFQNIVKLAVPQIADWCSVDIIEDDRLIQISLAHKDPGKIRLVKAMHKKYPPNANTMQGIPKVLTTGKTEFYPTITDEMLVQYAADPFHLRMLREIGFRSLIITPLIVNNKCIGTMTFVTSSSQRHYTKNDLILTEELARRASLAIENATLYQNAQKAIIIRDEFISVASHELKTPITSLKIYGQVLRQQTEKRGEYELLKYFDKMEAQINKLNMLVGDLLNVSKIQHGKIDYQMEKFNLMEIVQEAKESIQATAQKHEIIIYGRIAKKVYGDRYRIYQVLANLLTNAVKYSPKANNVLIHLIPKKQLALITVQDFGIGIEREHQSKIFNQFYRVTTTKEKTYPGLGMGLYIAHEIIKRHGGKMTVVSQKDKGSQFSFTLPYASRKFRN